jgi:hypothetical protein
MIHQASVLSSIPRADKPGHFPFFLNLQWDIKWEVSRISQEECGAEAAISDTYSTTIFLVARRPAAVSLRK